MTNDQNAMGPETLEIIVTSEAAYSMFMTTQACPAGRHLYVRADIHEQVVKDQEELRKRMTLLFKCIAPECEPFDYCHGLLSQIDNAIYGMKQKIEKLTGRPVPLTEWQKLEMERDALQRQLAQCREQLESYRDADIPGEDR